MEKVYFYSNSDQFYFDDEDDGAGYDDMHLLVTMIEDD